MYVWKSSFVLVLVFLDGFPSFLGSEGFRTWLPRENEPFLLLQSIVPNYKYSIVPNYNWHVSFLSKYSTQLQLTRQFSQQRTPAGEEFTTSVRSTIVCEFREPVKWGELEICLTSRQDGSRWCDDWKSQLTLDFGMYDTTGSSAKSCSRTWWHVSQGQMQRPRLSSQQGSS